MVGFVMPLPLAQMLKLWDEQKGGGTNGHSFSLKRALRLGLQETQATNLKLIYQLT